MKAGHTDLGVYGPPDCKTGIDSGAPNITCYSLAIMKSLDP